RRASTKPPSEVDRPPVDRERALAENLAEGRVRMRRPADLPWRRLEVQRDRSLRDQVGRARPDDVDAERVIGCLVGDDFREALVLPDDDRLGDRLERDL